MLPNNQTMQMLISDYSRQLVHQAAPEEGDLFDELIEEYFNDPTPPKQKSGAKDTTLGSGFGEVLIAATPAAAAIVSAVLTYLLTEIIKTTQEETASVLRKKIKQLFQQDTGPAALTREQLELVKKLARKQGRAFGLEMAEARKMADALVGVLGVQ